MFKNSHTSQSGGCRRFLALLLTLCMTLSLLPPVPAAAAAIDEITQFQPYINKLAEWDVMRGYADGTFRPNQPITRAQFVALMNRAYGYTKTGAMPFKDVQPTDWFYEDISMAYRAGYFTGTSKTTASPNDRLTREQAMVLLAKNMRLEPSNGEITQFTDGHDFSTYSRGYVKAAVDTGLINGYSDGTFRPKNYITRGQMAKLLANAVGNLVRNKGETSLGPVYGNVTINTPGVTLKNTTVAGNLYISGGLGLDSVVLDNVRVLGKIVVAGSGESQEGSESVVLRNVTAPELLVDNLAGDYVSVRSEGDTTIQNAFLRSSSYVLDRALGNYGLQNITLEGPEGAAFTLSGNLKNVIDKTPSSALTVSQGVVNTLTMDEHCTGSRLNVAPNTVINTLNLDTGVQVTGTGDIGTMNINASGTTSAILADNNVIRPGITAQIGGKEMDTAAALEASQSPRLLSGYPKASDVAPTSFKAIFSANKAGTVYWAVSSVSDGSVNEELLLSPPSYGTRVLKSGNLELSAADKPTTVQVSGLTSAGSYYLTAMLVDAQGRRSPIKVTSFATPDDSVPAFAAGYPVTPPKMSRMTGEDEAVKVRALVTFMTTKSCMLYYALFPNGSTAPTANEFKSGALSGCLASGTYDEVIRNRLYQDYLELTNLDETTTYDLYLWLTDADGAKSSEVKKITFTTPDVTPPEFRQRPRMTGNTDMTVTVSCTLNEAGSVYWVAVPRGTDYPEIAGDSDDDKMEWVRTQIINGINGTRSGKQDMQADVSGSWQISGLETEGYYDLYYVAADKADPVNYSIFTVSDPTKADYMTSIWTKDVKAPTVTQSFNPTVAGEPSPDDSAIMLTFRETIRYSKTSSSKYSLLDIKTMEAAGELGTNTLRDAMKDMFHFYDITEGAAYPVSMDENVKYNLFDVEYKTADKTMVVTIPAGAVPLKSGGSYYIVVENVTDMAGNVIENVNEKGEEEKGFATLPQFTTASAKVDISDRPYVTELTQPGGGTLKDSYGKTLRADMPFTLTPVSTASADPTLNWDLLIWADRSVTFDLYYRENDNADWKQYESGRSFTINHDSGSTGTYRGISFYYDSGKPSYGFPKLQSFSDACQYVIHITNYQKQSYEDDGWKSWDEDLHFRLCAVSGKASDLNTLAMNVTKNYPNVENPLDTSLASLKKITNRAEFTYLTAAFSDSRAPEFADGSPSLVPGSTSLSIVARLNRSGLLYYRVSPVGATTTVNEAGERITEHRDEIPHMIESVKNGQIVYTPSWYTVGDDGTYHYSTYCVNEPKRDDISDPDISTLGATIKTNAKNPVDVGTSDSDPIVVDGLQPNTDYFLYIVLKGTSEESWSKKVMLFQFRTKDSDNPVLTLTRVTSTSVTVKASTQCNLLWLLVQDNRNTWQTGDPLYGNVEKNSRETKVNALLTAYKSAAGVTTGTDFDAYASEDQKNSLWYYIKEGRPSQGDNSIAGWGEYTGVTEKTIDCDPEGKLGVGNYILLVTAIDYNEAQKAANKIGFNKYYNFSAMDRITPGSNNMPRVDNVTVTLEYKPKEDNSHVAGIVDVVLNVDLYNFLRSKSGQGDEAVIVDLAPASDARRTSTDGSLKPLSLETVTLPRSTMKPLLDYRYTVPDGSTIKKYNSYGQATQILSFEFGRTSSATTSGNNAGKENTVNYSYVTGRQSFTAYLNGYTDDASKYEAYLSNSGGGNPNPNMLIVTLNLIPTKEEGATTYDWIWEVTINKEWNDGVTSITYDNRVDNGT